MFNETRSILEPAGAVAVAGAKAFLKHYGLTGKRVVAVTSGANMNFDRLRLVSGARLSQFPFFSYAIFAVEAVALPGLLRRRGWRPCCNLEHLPPAYASPAQPLPLTPSPPPCPAELVDVGSAETMLAARIPDRHGAIVQLLGLATAPDGSPLDVTELKYRCGMVLHCSS